MATGLACAELRNAREQLRSARVGDFSETLTLAGVECLVNNALEQRLAPLEMQVAQLEERLLKSEAERRESDGKLEIATRRLRDAEATIAVLQMQASQADAKSYAEFMQRSPDWDASDATVTKGSPIAVSALFGSLRHYVQALIKRTPTEPELATNDSSWV
mmetsp:Transcript_104749/g.165365  ORF Transcript_104749/g.165365 Transcript_104749/m.165365 type:complete len:161 (+) Transcript_104749:120-602(+)|eukprot:CAMPEP_0169105600 /NCGR_PEP_ID=MMETSP1015-20121227/23882_1 /TAXON_ID=342587 /ORGANISM="Karlodinium micrum, Strain CCMP2283" /LENGTH=160 /DNA_ID=CAMNT_0009166969 /DNA_START=104 /DNA_END=586 /DNA_ORIENTATION=+